MENVQLLPKDELGFGFIPPEYLPAGKDEFWIRNEQNPKPEGYWRHLTAKEIEILVKNLNISDNWDHILVTDRFDPYRITHTEFYGLVRIGAMEDSVLRHHDLKLPVGISSSRIISCDLGDNVAIHNVQYLCHYIIGNRCILFNVDEMNTTNHARFGNGIVKEGEEESTRYWIDVINEAGGRSILPFDGMIPADAYLWATFREDKALMEQLFRFTQGGFDLRRGCYGTVGDSTVIKSCRIIKDVKIGSHCYIKGANKLKNLTINSSAEAPTQIGEGVELVNGIIGYGCNVFYGCKAVRFVLCDHSNLKYGARLIHSVLGENSTVSCCEILNNLVFPTHEQHHNNSFLVASLVMGQSNIAAGATIGSNHNSRANDGEIIAGRGFWPGLCVSLKHSSRFASFVLIQKGAYPAELNIPLPFSLVMNNEKEGRLEVMPAYWWMHNLYALKRNEWKFQNRDRRVTKIQHIEYSALAPDTVEEIFTAMRLLEEWVGKAYLSRNGEKGGVLSGPLRGNEAARLYTSDAPDSPSAGSGVAEPSTDNTQAVASRVSKTSGSQRILYTGGQPTSIHNSSNSFTKEGGANTNGISTDYCRSLGRSLLNEHLEILRGLTVYGEGMENSRRPVLILKPAEAYSAYRDMILYYGVKTLLEGWEHFGCSSYEEFARSIANTLGISEERMRSLNGSNAGNNTAPQHESALHPGSVPPGEEISRTNSTPHSPNVPCEEKIPALGRETEWFNLGGQIVPAYKVRNLLSDIRKSKISSWKEVHEAYDRLWEEYPVDKLRHAFFSLLELFEGVFTPTTWEHALSEAERIQEYILDGVVKSRKKDYENPFRQATFRNKEEERMVLGSLSDNSLLKQVEEETKKFKERLRKARA